MDIAENFKDMESPPQRRKRLEHNEKEHFERTLAWPGRKGTRQTKDLRDPEYNTALRWVGIEHRVSTECQLSR